MHELILYATPSGPLADACSRYFAAVEPTVAQTYPPHVTLTGFFHRHDARRATAAAIALDPVPVEAVEIKRLVCSDEWVGLEVGSPWLETAAAGFAERVQPGAGEDEIRLKDWLHLSLAYGIDDLARHGARAEVEIDVTADVAWEVALWERSEDNGWERLT